MLLLSSFEFNASNKFLKKGDVAQLARALDWQSRGRRFESDLLHKCHRYTTLTFKPSRNRRFFLYGRDEFRMFLLHRTYSKDSNILGSYLAVLDFSTNKRITYD